LSLVVLKQERAGFKKARGQAHLPDLELITIGSWSSIEWSSSQKYRLDFILD